MTTDRPLTCKFCGTELYVSSGRKEAFPMFRAADHHTTSYSDWGLPNTGWCFNRDGAITYHHPDSPEHNGGVDHSDGRSLRALADA